MQAAVEPARFLLRHAPHASRITPRSKRRIPAFRSGTPKVVMHLAYHDRSSCAAWMEEPGLSKVEGLASSYRSLSLDIGICLFASRFVFACRVEDLRDIISLQLFEVAVDNAYTTHMLFVH